MRSLLPKWFSYTAISLAALPIIEICIWAQPAKSNDLVIGNTSTLIADFQNLQSAQWKSGYFDSSGQFVPGNPEWGAVTATGGKFNSTAITSNQLVRRWQSNFSGQVNLSALLKTLDNTQIKAEIRLDGNPLMVIDSSQTTTAINTLSKVNIGVGSTLDFVFTPSQPEQNTVSTPSQPVLNREFEFRALVEATPGLVFNTVQTAVANPYAASYFGQPCLMALGYDCWDGVVPFPFNAAVKPFFTVAALIRSGPGTGFAEVSQKQARDRIVFDAWTRGEMVDQAYGKGDRWYRIAGTSTWMSETVVDNAPPEIPATVNVAATHVGLLATNHRIYESAPGYSLSMYRDYLTSSTTLVNPYAGVQAQHSLGSFIYQSTTSIPSTIRHQHVDIADEYADAISQIAHTKLGKSYLNIPACSISDYGCMVTPEEQKGENGQYSRAGFIESAAEAAGIKGGDGFIPTRQEDINVRQIITASASGGYQTLSVQGLQISMLTPEALERAASGLFQPSDNVLQGFVQSAYFILTAPNGLQLGYTKELGQFNQILGASLTSGSYVDNSPLALPSPPPSTGYPATNTGVDPYNPVQQYFQFFLPNREAGIYKLQLTGITKQAVVVITDHGQPGDGINPNDPEDGGTIIYPGEGGSVEVAVGVPEPSSILGLLTVGGLGALRKVFRKQKP